MFCSCIVSAVSLQVMVDRGRKQQENERFSVGVCAPHRLNQGLELNVCVVQCIKLSRVSAPLPLLRKRHFLFLYFSEKNIIYFQSLSHVISYRSKWAHIVPVWYCQPCIIKCILSLLKSIVTLIFTLLAITFSCCQSGCCSSAVILPERPSGCCSFWCLYLLLWTAELWHSCPE